MEASSAAAHASNPNGTFDQHALSANGEGEIVEAVAGSSHLPDEQLPQWRALLHEGQYTHTSRKEPLDAIPANQARPFHNLRRHQRSRTHILQKQPHL